MQICGSEIVYEIELLARNFKDVHRACFHVVWVYGLWVSSNLRKMFGTKRDEIKRCWRITYWRASRNLVIAKFHQDDQLMGIRWTRNAVYIMGNRKVFVILVGKFEGNLPFLLTWALTKQDSTLIWLRTRTKEGVFWKRKYALRIHKLRRVSWLAHLLVASYENLCFTVLFI